MDLPPRKQHLMENDEKKISRQEAAEIAVDAVMDEELQQNPPGGIWELDSTAYNVIQRLKQKDQEQFEAAQAFSFLGDVRAKIQRRLQQRVKAEARADARQGVLALPGFNLVSPWVKLEDRIVPLNKVTVKQHRDSVKDRETRIKRMEYPRWSEDRMKNEKAALVQERKLDRKVAPLTAGDPEMEMGRAMQLFDQFTGEDGSRAGADGEDGHREAVGSEKPLHAESITWSMQEKPAFCARTATVSPGAVNDGSGSETETPRHVRRGVRGDADRAAQGRVHSGGPRR